MRICFGILIVRLLSSSGRAYNDIGFEIEGSGRKVGISTALAQVHAPLVLVLRETSFQRTGIHECWLEAMSGRSGFSILSTGVLALMHRSSDSEKRATLNRLSIPCSGWGKRMKLSTWQYCPVMLVENSSMQSRSSFLVFFSLRSTKNHPPALTLN